MYSDGYLADSPIDKTSLNELQDLGRLDGRNIEAIDPAVSAIVNSYWLTVRSRAGLYTLDDAVAGIFRPRRAVTMTG